MEVSRCQSTFCFMLPLTSSNPHSPLAGFFLLLNMFVAILNDAIDEVSRTLVRRARTPERLLEMVCLLPLRSFAPPSEKSFAHSTRSKTQSRKYH